MPDRRKYKYEECKCPYLGKKVTVTLIWSEIDGQRISKVKVNTCDSVQLCEVSKHLPYDWTKCPIVLDLQKRQVQY